MSIPHHDPNNPTHNHGMFIDTDGTKKIYGAGYGPGDTVGHSHTLEEYYELHGNTPAFIARPAKDLRITRNQT